MSLRPKVICVFTSLASAFAAAQLNAADWYVATNGLDGANGSLGAPFATIGRAVTAASAGDIIFLRGGTYNLSSTVNLNKTGNAAARFTLQNYQNEQPILSFKNQTVGGSSRGVSLSGGFWNVRGFTIEYAGDNGMIISGSNNVIERMVARQNNDSGFAIQGTGTSNNLILNSDSYGNYDNQGTNFGENADGFAVKFRGLGPGNVLRGNRAWNNSDDGYDFWQAENRVTVENCWAFNNGKSSIFQGLASFNGDGNGMKLGHDSGTHLLRGNVVFGNPTHGIDVNGNATQLEGDPPTIAHGVTIYNNTGFNNGGENFNFDENPTTATPAAQHILRNNLSLNVTTGGAQSANVTIMTGNTHDHNSWNAPLSAGTIDFMSLTNPVVDGTYRPATDRTGATSPIHATGISPRLPDGSIAPSPFLRLKWGSALINAGTNVGGTFYYANPDLGAFEAAFPGDANFDGTVNISDFALLAANFNTPGDFSRGDFNYDGTVNISDFAVLASNFNLSIADLPRASVPEPALLGVSPTLWMLWRARVRRSR